MIHLKALLLESSVSETDIIAATLIGEAGGEPDPGMKAIANVLRNRKNSSDFPNSYKSVILRHGDAFEMWIGKTPETLVPKKKKHSRWDKAYQLAKDIDSIDDVTGGATHYYAHSGDQQIPPPYWTDNAELKRRAEAEMEKGGGFKAWEWIPKGKIHNHKFGKLIRRKLKKGDFTIYPNPVKARETVTIKVNPDHLPQRLIKIKIPEADYDNEWYNEKLGKLNFNAPSKSGLYSIKIFDNNNKLIDIIKLKIE
jgi:hypothetical protein